MKAIHFYKLSTRLGMRNIPYHGNELNMGVEKGPEAILSQLFLRSLAHPFSVDGHIFPTPESTSSNYYKILSGAYQESIQIIMDTLKPNEIQVCIGGDHSMALTSLAARLNRTLATELGYIQFDSHGDIHQSKTSTTGNFHGMWLRPFLDTFDIEEINTLIPNKIPTNNILYIGNLDLENEEREYVDAHSIQVLSATELSNGHKVQQTIETFILSHPHLHVSFDIDVFDRTVAPATGTPSSDGLNVSTVLPLLTVMATHPDLSIDIVEVNPIKNGADRTIQLAQLVLKTLLGIT